MGMKQEDQKSEKPYVPPMGDLSKSFKPLSQPLMLTNGSNAPGAASAEIRALSDPQKAGGLRVCITCIMNVFFFIVFFFFFFFFFFFLFFSFFLVDI